MIFVMQSIGHLENIGSLAYTKLPVTVGNLKALEEYIFTSCESAVNTGQPPKKSESLMTNQTCPYRLKTRGKL